MSYLLPTGAVLGAAKANLDVGYRLISGGVQVQAWTNVNVVETDTPGTYDVTGGIPLPDGFTGRIEWGEDGSDGSFAEEWVGPRSYENLDAKVSSIVGGGIGSIVIDDTITLGEALKRIMAFIVNNAQGPPQLSPARVTVKNAAGVDYLQMDIARDGSRTLTVL